MFELQQLKNLIIDMDGVLWRGSTPMPGLASFFETLQELNINYILATNNASKTAAQYVERLANFGVTMTADHIFTSSLATAAYLAEEYPAGTAIYVVGDKGLRQALDEGGFTVVNPAVEEASRNGLAPRRYEAELVVVGFYQGACYRHFAEATILLNGGARLIGSNPDVTFPSEWGPLPGAGALLALLQAATGSEPTIVGKPGPIMFHEALRRLNGGPMDTAMVGDRLETDIAGGRAAGIGTILVLSGIATRDDLAESHVQPDHVFEDINALAASLREQQRV